MLSETPQQLVDRTSALIEVATEAWIVTGRHPLPLLMAAVYVAWQSLNPKVRGMASAKCGECFTLLPFCSLDQVFGKSCTDESKN